MKRTSRFIFNSFAMVSLLLCLATLILWARSYWAMDAFDFRSGSFELNVLNPPGRLALAWINPEHPARVAIGVSSTADGFSHSVWDLPEPSFREDIAAYVLAMHYHPFFNWEKVWGRFCLFNVASAPPDLGRPLSAGPPPPNVPDEIWGRGFAVPSWFAVVMLSVLPIARSLVGRQWRRARPGVCIRCGYELRATPDRCPECGTVPKSPVPIPPA